MAYVAPRTWVTGEVVTAAQLNQDVRDNILFLAASTLGYAQVTASQTGISTLTDLTGLTVTVTVTASRRIRIFAQGRVDCITSNGVIVGHVREGSTTLGRWCDSFVTGGTPLLTNGAVILTPSAGSHTYKLSLEKSSGGNTVTLAAGTDVPAFILVEDIGAA